MRCPNTGEAAGKGSRGEGDGVGLVRYAPRRSRDGGDVMRFGVLIVAALALGGCKTAAERQAADLAEADGYCASIGARPGTDAYVQCRLQLRAEEARTVEARRNRVAATPEFKLGVAPVQSPVVCNSTPFLGSIQTTCN